MLKNPIVWTISTAIITTLVYIDIFILDWFLFTIPLALVFAVMSIIVSIVQKQYVYIILNLLLAIAACMSYLLFPW